MSPVILIIALSLSQARGLNIRGPVPPRERIINVSNAPGDNPIVMEHPPWVSLTRGQFMRDIMYGIHPESPRNREVWIKSGLLRPQNHQLRNIPLPSSQGQWRVNPKPENKIKRPLRRKLIPTQRLPKLTDINDEFLTRNITEVKTNQNQPILPASNSEALKAPRCFIQTTVPVVYYLVPVAAPYPFNLQNSDNIQQKPSLFETGQYVPIQNRLPYPPRVVYLSPVPLDLLAMEGSKDEQELSFTPTITKTTAPAPKPVVNSVPPKLVPLQKKQGIKEGNNRIIGPPQITDMEFRGDTLPVDIHTKGQVEVEKDVNELKNQKPKDDIGEQTVGVVIEERVEQDVQDEISFKEDDQESATSSSFQEIVTPVLGN